MEKINECICCDVTECCHNCGGRNCGLDEIKVTGNCRTCTCCGSFESNER